ncbi:MAG: ArsR/SmtB family transcription factor [Rhodospirillaceae bacterium]
MANMVSGNALAEVASLVGDAARANMLLALMGGRALTAGELAWQAGVSAQTASGHLAKLAASGAVALEKQGRHRYYRIASPAFAQAMEALMAVAAVGPARHRPIGPGDTALRTARTCYDHMAGRLGVALADALIGRGYVVMGEDAVAVTREGQRFFRDLGIDLETGVRSRRPLCRTCLDWSERRPHLAGRLGAALLDQAAARGWVVRDPGGRALTVTGAGRRAFAERFGLPPDWMV